MTSSTLAAAVGHVAVAQPPALLRRHVALTWVHRLPDRPIDSVATVPDGNIELRWIDGRLDVDGPHRAAVREALPPGTLVVGLRFRPGAAPAWLGLPASDLADRCVPLDDLWGSDARRLAEWAGEASSPNGIARRLERGLLDRAPASVPGGGEAARIFALLDCGVGAADVAALLGVAERTLRRRCHDVVGYGPGTLARILRFQRFLRLLHDRPEGHGLAWCAAAAGYADQPHLCREARRLSGLSPREIAGQIGR